MKNLLDAVWNEHRSIAAVLHALQYLARDQRAHGRVIDPRAFRAMLYYLDVFPERLHHRKEEDYLFAAVRRKTTEANAILDELDAEHHRGEASIRELEQLLLRYEEGGDDEFAAFADAVERFVAGYREHIRKEEELVMPIARRVLSPTDWSDLTDEWNNHRDPLSGIEPGLDYEAVLDRIIAFAPPPIGVARTD